MPTVKIEKESELYFEIKAKYESSQFADDTLAKTYGISGKQLVRIAKRDQWSKGKQKSPQNIKDEQKTIMEPIVEKVLEIQAQLQENKQPETPPQKTSLELRKEQAKESAMQTDEIVNAIVDQFYEEGKLKNFIMSTGLLGMHRIRQTLLTNKQYYDGKEQQVGLQTSTHYLRMAQAFDTIAGTLGFGSQKGGVNFLIQNNNNNEAKVENKTTEIPKINFVKYEGDKH